MDFQVGFCLGAFLEHFWRSPGRETFPGVLLQARQAELPGAEGPAHPGLRLVWIVLGFLLRLG